MENDKELRYQLVNMLTVRQAHMDFEDAVADFPAEHINTRLQNSDYTFWHLIEHIRLAQNDILEYITAKDYSWPNWPDAYWPDLAAETNLEGWHQTVAQFYADRQKLADVINDPTVDLFASLPNSGERTHNIVREINVVANHNAYHTGELGILRQVMVLWS